MPRRDAWERLTPEQQERAREADRARHAARRAAGLVGSTPEQKAQKAAQDAAWWANRTPEQQAAKSAKDRQRRAWHSVHRLYMIAVLQRQATRASRRG